MIWLVSADYLSGLGCCGLGGLGGGVGVGEGGGLGGVGGGVLGRRGGYAPLSSSSTKLGSEYIVSLLLASLIELVVNNEVDERI